MFKHLVDGTPKNRKRSPKRELPIPQKLVQRRVLVCRSAIGLDPLLIFVDDDSSCARADIRHGGDWSNGSQLFHLYAMPSQFAGPTSDSQSIVAIRCPKSLEDNEWDRIVLDIPEGSRFQAAKEWCKKNGRYRTKKSKPAESGPGYTFDEHGN